ncbi:Glucan endo-1,3-beta-glucosidase BGN13.1 [Cladobotryum mycophilum]|uniref:Glucan endo-1,3-beta-glucosidase BGN13.1 n=1 Tax=Cladobotryum mycophilum TaxID=491253 RepID=A0ABR0SHF9_9HYPO
MLRSLVALAAVLGAVSASPPASRDAAAAESPRAVAASSYWYANMDHSGTARGYAPHTDNPGSYSVYVAVNAGDAGGIQRAIDSGNRHQQWLASQPRVVYLPPGTYEVGSTINMRTDTILMGDASNPPIIKAARGFNGGTLLNGQDPSTGQSGEISFSVGVKNVILDTSNVDSGNGFTALYWGVAQACQLQNIKIQMPRGSQHNGIRLGRGSTLGLADVRIEGGNRGIYHNGHQQAMYKNIYFYQNTVGFFLDGGNTVSLLAPTFDSVGTAVQVNGGSPFVGLIDAKSVNSGVTFKSSVYPSFVIDNLTRDSASANVVEVPNYSLKGATHVDNFSYGNTVGRNPIYGPTSASSNRPAALAPGGRVPSVNAPTYGDKSVSDFINVKDSSQNGGVSIKGDGSGDESDALNKVLAYAAKNNKIAYFPFGDYRVQKTLLIPIGSRIVGEAWSTISGAGQFFKDSNNPKPVVQVGNAGDVGVAQIQDMRFTVADVLPGAIIVQFQAAGANAGDVALWNSFVTVGGVRGADGLTNNCGNSGAECQGAFIGIHLAKSSSAYIENVWNWVADHITEGFGGGSSIAGKGGVLVEATKGTWLHGLGSEHWWLYQLNLHNAENVVVTMLQTETNYEQGDNAGQTAPAPWTPNTSTWGDPDFSWCNGGSKRCHMGLSNYVNGGANIYYYGSASWAFFSGPGYQGCSGAYTCQDYIHLIKSTPKNLQMFGMCSKDTRVALRLGDGTDIIANDGFTGGWSPGGDVGRYTS